VNETDGITGNAYFVDTRPQVAWAWDLEARNLDFLRGIEPGYFAHIARTQGPFLEAEDRSAHFAAAAIRLAYSQGIETLFALLGAFAQAPHAPIGWMLAYNNSELREVTAAVASSEGLVDNTPWNAPVTLEFLANASIASSGWDAAKKREVASGFHRLWRQWAQSLIGEAQTDEYNALKHGLRVALGGFSLRLGAEEESDQASRGFAASSEYGSTYFLPQQIHGRLHIYPRRRSQNWNASSLTVGLELIAMSIRNVTSELRTLGGDDAGDCVYEAPGDEAVFETRFHPEGGLIAVSLDMEVTSSHIPRMSKEAVLQGLQSRQGRVAT
jgi:hypothetical protein